MLKKQSEEAQNLFQTHPIDLAFHLKVIEAFIKLYKNKLLYAANKHCINTINIMKYYTTTIIKLLYFSAI